MSQPPATGHEIVRTRAGDLAIRSVAAGEVMHPGVGPLREARELYVRQSRLAERLRAPGPGPLVLFDIGLGAGSNALCAREESERAGGEARRLQIISFERDLGALELALTAGPAFAIEGESAGAVRALLATGAHDSARTGWQLRQGDLLARLGDERARADVIFWDPFSPRANPELWTVAAFASVRACAGPTCTLFTYSAATATRVALLLAGWAVGAGDATGTRPETTAAAVRAEDLARPLGARFLQRLARSGAVLPADAPADTHARVAAAPQFAVP